jgi:predicted lipoprotein with Yx(FWY)xxD motif
MAMVVAACGRAPSAGSGPSPSSFHGPSYQIDAAQVDGLGRVLVDGKGDTLYLFVPDHHDSVSRCHGICAVEWPPLLLPSGVRAPVAGRGVRASLLGTTRRSDGRLQVTYGGWPLYRWFGDTAPGMATGQGLDNLGGLWYVVSPDGQPVR